MTIPDISLKEALTLYYNLRSSAIEITPHGHPGRDLLCELESVFCQDGDDPREPRAVTQEVESLTAACADYPAKLAHYLDVVLPARAHARRTADDVHQQAVKAIYASEIAAGSVDAVIRWSPEYKGEVVRLPALTRCYTDPDTGRVAVRQGHSTTFVDARTELWRRSPD